jgi:hypothetical protein
LTNRTQNANVYISFIAKQKERIKIMALGLGSLVKKSKQGKAPVAKKSSSASDEAAEILKKMDEKAASGACPFC